MCHGFDVRPDICATDTKTHPSAPVKAGKIWVDSLVHDSDALRLLIKVMGENRVVLGSDYPFPLGEHKPGQLICQQENMSDETKQRLLWDNCFDLFGSAIDRKKY